MMIPAIPAPSKRARHTCASHFSIMALALAVMLTLFLYPVHTARASGGGSVDWDSSMIYPGQNNGNPWGPVGERALVHVNYIPNQLLNLKLVVGDAYPGDGSFSSVCQQTGIALGSVTTDNNGSYDFAFNWPASAGQVNQGYSICSVSPADGIVHAGSHPFTVLSSNPPVISLSSSSVAAGDTVTVTGQNWVPPQKINIIIAACADCGAGNTIVANVSVDSSGLNNGNFSSAITIPASAKPGNYVVDALSQNALLDANYTTTNGAQHLTITAPILAVTPTPTPTITPTATAAPTPTATTTNTTAPPTNTDTGSSSNSNLGFIIGLIIAGILMLGAIVAVIVYVVMRRSSRRRRALYPPSGVPGQFMQQGPGSGQSYGPTMPVPGAGRTTQSIPPYSTPSQFDQTAATNFPANSPGSIGRPTQSIPPYTSPSQFGQTAPTKLSANSPGNVGRSTPPLFCANCGALLQPDETFCGQCGTLATVKRPEGDSPTWVG